MAPPSDPTPVAGDLVINPGAKEGKTFLVSECLSALGRRGVQRTTLAVGFHIRNTCKSCLCPEFSFPGVGNSISVTVREFSCRSRSERGGSGESLDPERLSPRKGPVPGGRVSVTGHSSPRPHSCAGYSELHMPSGTFQPAHRCLPVCLQMCTSSPLCRSCGRSLLSLWSAVCPCTFSSTCGDGSPRPATRSSRRRRALAQGTAASRSPGGQSSSCVFLNRHLWILQ